MTSTGTVPDTAVNLKYDMASTETVPGTAVNLGI